MIRMPHHRSISSEDSIAKRDYERLRGLSNGPDASARYSDCARDGFNAWGSRAGNYEPALRFSEEESTIGEVCPAGEIDVGAALCFGICDAALRESNRDPSVAAIVC